MKCLFCEKENSKKQRYGICVSCKISILKTMKKKDYKLLIKDKDIKLVREDLVQFLIEEGYKEIK